MALQGTIDTFPLTDVLHLLATSAKTGRLVLDGDRGTATLWIDEGRVLGGGPGPVASAGAAGLVFTLLRFREGSFSFDDPPAGEAPEIAVRAEPLLDCVAAARVLADEWREIEAVVPSRDHRVRLAAALSSESITIDASTWAVLVAAGTRPSVEEFSRTLDLGEYDGAKAVAGLVARGLLEVREPTEEPATRADLAAPPAETPVVTTAFPERFPIDDLIGGDDQDATPWTPVEPLSAPGSFASADQGWDQLIDDALDEADRLDAPAVDPAAQVAPPEAIAEEDDSTAEVLKQMSRLSPQAAEAIAAALNTGADTSPVDDEPDAPVSFLGTL